MGSCSSSQKVAETGTKTQQPPTAATTQKDAPAVEAPKANTAAAEGTVTNPATVDKKVLYYHVVSQPSRSCAWLVDYMNLNDVELKPVDIFKGEQKQPEYTEKFPAGQVPAFEDGEFAFGESTAILQYLTEDTHALWPTDKKGRTLLQQYFGRHPTAIRPITLKYLLPVFIAPKSAEEKAAAAEKELSVIEPVLKEYEAILGKQPYVLGDSLSLADFLFAPEIDQLVWCKADLLESYPNISKYLARLREEVPSYVKNFEDANKFAEDFSEARGF
ncbi:Glutathione S-transferase [Diplonema papillatum]|nr:Glutathione S-transferase [Diplonema papillatum]KAJ9466544.1 Glutathione S-transferase [Diplonema papillatum]